MNMNKRNLLTVMLAILPFTSVLAFDFEVNGIYYNILSESKIEVTSGTDKYAGDVIIPKLVENNGTSYKVIKIGNRAFDGCTELASVEIPNSVITIGEYNQEIEGETNVEIIPVSA